MRFCETGGEPANTNRKTWRQLQALVAAIAVAGCSTMAAHQATDYDPGSASPDKLSKDADSCAKQAEANAKEYGMGPYDPTHGAYNRMFDACMQAGGYARKKP